tara:strand:- start:773 stop:931 length:159 start_codon:yes stop_codon:yes gene_type:complete
MDAAKVRASVDASFPAVIRHCANAIAPAVNSLDTQAHLIIRLTPVFAILAVH